MFEIKPKTRKEIYMAYLAGDMSLELPEPLTRDEVNLYNLCQSHAYGSTTTAKEVLAECQPEFVADIGGFMLAGNFPIVAGETYIVNWNGKDYPCVSALISGDSSSGEIGFGNASAGGGEDSGEPFFVGYQYSDRTEINGLAIIPLDGSTTLTISIRQEVITVQKMSGKYVEGMGWSESGWEIAVNETVSEWSNCGDHFTNGNTELMKELEFVVGNKYKVVFDGTAYECECKVFSLGGMSMPVIGNMGLSASYGFEDTGEPFCIFMDGNYLTVGVRVQEPHALELYYVSETIHPIDQKFMNVVLVKFETADGQNFTSADKTIDEIIEAFKNGKTIVGYYEMDMDGRYVGGELLLCGVNKTDSMKSCLFNTFVIAGTSMVAQLLTYKEFDGETTITLTTHTSAN